ncbi:PH domain-containing rcdII [Porphyridium purpureum]|uniref:PH domain-containing rcdII n=1 Tax=Porphyridium purpureum TaxID=35688 RepID=A0A5J4YPU1_PORPP|nr:PH domain-containing rcdII [Porphyridium purpureum]|eukprot:POR9266..scf296_7
MALEWDSMNAEQLRRELLEMRRELLTEKHRRTIAEEQYSRLKESVAQSVKQVEAEEELISNTLMKRLAQLKMEKEKLALQIEEEEEFLTNNLQMKLEKLKHEKVDLENQMEQEQEFIVNKLQRQLDELRAEKLMLERRVEQLSTSSTPLLAASAVSQPHSPSFSSMRLNGSSNGISVAAHATPSRTNTQAGETDRDTLPKRSLSMTGGNETASSS